MVVRGREQGRKGEIPTLSDKGFWIHTFIIIISIIIKINLVPHNCYISNGLPTLVLT